MEYSGAESMKKTILSLLLSIAFLQGLFAMGGSSGNSSGGGKKIKLKLANELSTEHTGNIIYRYFADKVKEYSQGNIEITIYPNGTLGKTKELVEQAQADTLDFVHSSAAYLENFASEYAVFGLPYIFENKEHFAKAMNGAFGKRFQGPIPAEIGFRGTFYLYGGTRSFYATKPIHSIEDLAGLKIRVMPSSVAIEMVNVIGASPTPMSFGEVYSALQQGVLDGAENNPTSYISARHYEVAKYYIFDEHQSVPDFLLMNVDRWNSLSPEQQGIISKAALEAQNQALADWDKQQEDAILKAKAAGCTFIYLDKAPFQRKVQKMISDRTSKEPVIAELLDLVNQAK